MMKIRNKFLTATLLLALGGLQAAAAALITTTLGNATPGFSDGSTPPATGTGSIFVAQSGQPAPFDQPCGGSDATGLDCSASWTFNYAAIVDPILSASITIGIVDHDSSASLSQLDSFTVDGDNLTTSLNSLFEGSGGGDAMYNVYTLDLLDAGLQITSLLNGSLLVNLALGGNGLDTCTLIFICPGAPVVSETDFNAANLIFSTLTIETQDITIPPVPIPAAAPLFLSAIAAFGLYRRRVLRDKA